MITDYIRYIMFLIVKQSQSELGNLTLSFFQVFPWICTLSENLIVSHRDRLGKPIRGWARCTGTGGPWLRRWRNFRSTCWAWPAVPCRIMDAFRGC